MMPRSLICGAPLSMAKCDYEKMREKAARLKTDEWQAIDESGYV
jgi:hypothetical protein